MCPTVVVVPAECPTMNDRVAGTRSLENSDHGPGEHGTNSVPDRIGGRQQNVCWRQGRKDGNDRKQCQGREEPVATERPADLRTSPGPLAPAYAVLEPGEGAHTRHRIEACHQGGLVAGPEADQEEEKDQTQ